MRAMEADLIAQSCPSGPLPSRWAARPCGEMPTRSHMGAWAVGPGLPQPVVWVACLFLLEGVEFVFLASFHHQENIQTQSRYIWPHSGSWAQNSQCLRGSDESVCGKGGEGGEGEREGDLQWGLELFFKIVYFKTWNPSWIDHGNYMDKNFSYLPRKIKFPKEIKIKPQTQFKKMKAQQQ